MSFIGSTNCIFDFPELTPIRLSNYDYLRLSKGIIYMLYATLGFSVMQGLIKQISYIHVFQIIFFRSSITAILSTGILLNNRVPLKGKNYMLLSMRVIFGLISMTLFFITIQRIPFGASLTLRYLSPLFAFILSFLFLKERIKSIQWLFFIMALIGVLLLKGFDSRIDNISLWLSILGAFFAGCVYVTIRKIGDTEHPLVIVNHFMVTAAVISGILMVNTWTTPNIYELGFLLIIGASGYFGQRYMTESFQLEETNVVAPLKYTELVYAFLIGYLFFDESYDLLTCSGLFLIILSFLLNFKYGTR